MTTIVDLFAGPGGWDLGAAAAGLEDPVGIEHGIEECASRRAAGLTTLQGDVAAVPLESFRGLEGLIASPPCQAWSMAGRGDGRTHDIEVVERAAADLYDEETQMHLQAEALTSRDLLATYAAECRDPRSILVVEPLRWALELEPTWIAWEQVPPVLPFWETCAGYLEGVGYTTWTGLLSAEQYGVPQTRTRAFLLAARDGRPVGPPPATHQRYLPPRKHHGGGLFDVDDLERRRVHPEDEHLLPWISMAEALGLPMGVPLDYHRGAGMTARHGERPERTTSQPAPTVTAGEGRGSGTRWTFRNGNQPNAAVRTVDEPAPTIHFGHNANAVDWVMPTGYDRRQVDGRTGVPVRVRGTDEPAPTITGEANGAWVFDRPATTVAGDPRIQPPGHKINSADLAAGRDGYDGRAGTNAVRVTVEQAAALQSFPVGYPWQGSNTARYRQVGNAVPPRLAAAVLASIGGAS